MKTREQEIKTEKIWMLGYGLVLQKKKKEKNSNIKDKAYCCKVNKMEITY